MEQFKKEEQLKESYYKRYGVVCKDSSKTKKTLKSLTMSLIDMFVLLRKRKK
jgi:hypothetical protein